VLALLVASLVSVPDVPLSLPSSSDGALALCRSSAARGATRAERRASVERGGAV
jgi:hypothetical protein